MANLALFAHCSCNGKGIARSKAKSIGNITGYTPSVKFTKSDLKARELLDEYVEVPRGNYMYLLNLDTGLWADIGFNTKITDEVRADICKVSGK